MLPAALVFQGACEPGRRDAEGCSISSPCTGWGLELSYHADASLRNTVTALSDQAGRRWPTLPSTSHEELCDAPPARVPAEFVASEALHHLGVPTTRALSLGGTGAKVVRDMFYKCARCPGSCPIARPLAAPHPLRLVVRAQPTAVPRLECRSC